MSVRQHRRARTRPRPARRESARVRAARSVPQGRARRSRRPWSAPHARRGSGLATSSVQERVAPCPPRIVPRSHTPTDTPRTTSRHPGMLAFAAKIRSDLHRCDVTLIGTDSDSRTFPAKVARQRSRGISMAFRRQNDADVAPLNTHAPSAAFDGVTRSLPLRLVTPLPALDARPLRYAQQPPSRRPTRWLAGSPPAPP